MISWTEVEAEATAFFPEALKMGKIRNDRIPTMAIGKMYFFKIMAFLGEAIFGTPKSCKDCAEPHFYVKRSQNFKAV